MRALNLFLLFVYLLVMNGCASTSAPPKQEKPVERYVPTFYYAPPSKVEIGSAGVTYALVNPYYSQKEDWQSQSIFNNFSQNMAR